jgi:hypothetical protein
LQKVPVIVTRDDLKPGAHREPDQRHERIPEPYPIDVVFPRATNDVADRRVAGDEAVEN